MYIKCQNCKTWNDWRASKEFFYRARECVKLFDSWVFHKKSLKGKKINWIASFIFEMNENSSLDSLHMNV